MFWVVQKSGKKLKQTNDHSKIVSSHCTCTETVAWRVGFSMSTRRLNRIEWLTKGLKSPWPPSAATSFGCRTGRRTHSAGHRAHRAGQPRPRWAADLVCMGGIWLCTADCTISMMMRRGSLTNWLCPPNRAYLIRSSSVYIRGCQINNTRTHGIWTLNEELNHTNLKCLGQTWQTKQL